MSVLINTKICDIAKECSGITECPTRALFWDDEANKIEIDSSKCTCCKVCITACPVGAIHVADNQEEYEKIKLEIDNDPRSIDDLFVDRYGATPIDDTFLMVIDQFESQISKSKGLMFVEFFNESSIQCLLKAIPVKEIIGKVKGCAAYMKVEGDNSICTKFQIENLPTLLVFNNGLLIGKIDGFYETSQQDKMLLELSNIINNNRTVNDE